MLKVAERREHCPVPRTNRRSGSAGVQRRATRADQSSCPHWLPERATTHSWHSREGAESRQRKGIAERQNGSNPPSVASVGSQHAEATRRKNVAAPNAPVSSLSESMSHAALHPKCVGQLRVLLQVGCFVAHHLTSRGGEAKVDLT
jgi:hypothetical protein